MDMNGLQKQIERFVTQSHVALYRSSGGLLGGWMLVPVLLLTTTGRRSQQQRTTPLTFFPDGDDFVVIASYGGARHPDWWLNLEAQPRAEVEVGLSRYSTRLPTSVLTAISRTVVPNRAYSDRFSMYHNAHGRPGRSAGAYTPCPRYGSSECNAKMKVFLRLQKRNYFLSAHQHPDSGATVLTVQWVRLSPDIGVIRGCLRSGKPLGAGDDGKSLWWNKKGGALLAPR